MQSILTCRVALPSDAPVLWKMLEPIVRLGGTYVFSLDTSQEAILAYWMEEERTTFLVERNGSPLGTFYLKSNQVGLGSHVANAGFVVSQEAQSQGIGRWMGNFALQEAQRRGFLAMQFNFVIQTNEKAVRLWKSLGFEVLCEVPEAYRHPDLGLVSALVMHKKI